MSPFSSVEGIPEWHRFGGTHTFNIVVAGETQINNSPSREGWNSLKSEWAFLHNSTCQQCFKEALFIFNVCSHLIALVENAVSWSALWQSYPIRSCWSAHPEWASPGRGWAVASSGWQTCLLCLANRVWLCDHVRVPAQNFWEDRLTPLCTGRQPGL